MRLVHLADLHLGFRQYQRLTPSGINQREADVAATVLRATAQIVDLAPELIVIGGDIFHTVRPSNPAIVHAYRVLMQLRDRLPDTPIVMVAGNHDAPRTAETGCILRLFREIGVFVADAKAELFTFPQQSLAVLAVPDVPGIDRPPLLPPDGFTHRVLLLHGEIAGLLPAHAASADRAAIEIPPAALHAEQWSYVALGHYHVYREVATRAYYSGSLDYTSSNPWGELREEKEQRIPGKGFIEHDLVSGAHRFHPVQPSRPLLDLEYVDASGMSAQDLDSAIKARVDTAPGGIDDRVVRLTVRNVARHVVRELDHAALRDYRKRAMHFHLDTRRPDPLPRRAGDGSGGRARRATLPELVAERLRERALPADVDREQFVTLGMRYLKQAEDAAMAALPVLES
ncbi:MAG: DNA repair exonuclease [Gemmatimonas sp.]|jgi:DNA repair exonuclease SbcCD nuclease subunit|uniref:exonuclease SbcCD subunit D n=1 Tax=Gemmatimonas sp. TaxID=1962908 RepID=UPI0031C48618|nr:DNA repair exonuclease [Gemmatimonas sp.]